MRRRSLLSVIPIVLSAAGATQPTLPQTGRIVWVTDGDTVRLESGERVRIADIDAPETRAGQARCRAEIAVGKRSALSARGLLEGRVVSIERVGVSYGRTVARLRLDGNDVAQLLVSHEVARWWRRGSPKPVWCPIRS